MPECNIIFLCPRNETPHKAANMLQIQHTWLLLVDYMSSDFLTFHVWCHLEIHPYQEMWPDLNSILPSSSNSRQKKAHLCWFWGLLVFVNSVFSYNIYKQMLHQPLDSINLVQTIVLIKTIIRCIPMTNMLDTYLGLFSEALSKLTLIFIVSATEKLHVQKI